MQRYEVSVRKRSRHTQLLIQLKENISDGEENSGNAYLCQLGKEKKHCIIWNLPRNFILFHATNERKVGKMKNLTIKSGFSLL